MPPAYLLDSIPDVEGVVVRFLPEGPNIPDQLLEERDVGNVVFFCGAGVSLSAGMPTFEGLTRYVVQELGAPPDAQSRKMLARYDDPGLDPAGLPAFDHIFNVLQQEYPAGEIDHHIARRLTTKAGVSLAAHEAVLRLSRSADGKPQVVTTNFDLLFEKAAGKRLKRFVHPALPDLTSGQPLDGLVYLHGRLNSRMRRGDGRQGFVVSSSDFGRAYLAEGWATRFVRDLLDRYTVVLLGYSANDPPVRYLLQGLHTRSYGARAAIYAFDSGADQEVQNRWRDSGVLALSYYDTDREHSALWNTLYAWAERADDPIGWQENVVKLARRGPRSLTAAQRGQVASVVRTSVGANLFASDDPPPPGEWLCVFDAGLRYAEIGDSFDESVPDFDPLAEYGLDDDPPRPPKTGPRTAAIGDDLLADRQIDRQDHSLTRLAGIPRQWADPVSPRLFHLARWVGRVAHEPVTVWWAARYFTLHPKMLHQIENRVERQPNDLPEIARSGWTLLIEKFRIAPEDDLDTSWYDTLRRIKAEGWTRSVLRSFERATRPYLKSKLPFGISRARPPSNDWSETNLRDIVKFEVAFPGTQGDQPGIPLDVLPQVYRTLRRHLELTAGLLSDIGQQHWHTKSFYPEDRPGRDHVDEASAYLLWFRKILDQMIENQSPLVVSDSVLWPEDEPFFFDKLRLYVWAQPALFSGKFVASQLLAISDGAFWASDTRRELLFLLKERWSQFPAALRRRIENRIASGQSRYEGEDEDDYVKWRSATSAGMLGWLQREGSGLTEATLKKLVVLRRANPDWNPRWDENAASSNEGRGGWVRTDPDPGDILKLPLNQVIPVATERTRNRFGEFVHYRPFEGLMAQRPARAVAALTLVSRQGEYPQEFWRAALQEWPENASSRLTRLFAERLARLPQEIVVDLRFSLFYWAKNHLRRLAQPDPANTLRILDALLDKLFQGGDAATQSSTGDISVGGESLNLSRRTYDHAINSPVGDAAQLLLTILDDMKLAKGARIPDNIRMRVDGLTRSPGEGRDHAVCVIARDIKWLYHVDPEWVEATVIPWFNLDYELAEPAWNGFLNTTDLPRPALFAKIKPDFLEVVVHASGWAWEDSSIRRLQEFLVQGCFWHQNEPAYITFDEARAAMQATDDAGRVHCLWFLTRIMKEAQAWRKFVKPFLDKAWPRELRCQTEATSSQFATLAVDAGDLFPEVVNAVLPYLGPISRMELIIHRLKNLDGEEGTELPARFPSDTLALLYKLVPDEPGQAPYDLRAVVKMIGDADPTLQQDPRWRRLNRIALSA